jgi:hypothetical protein
MGLNKWEKALLIAVLGVIALLYLESILSIRFEYYEVDHYQTDGKTYQKDNSFLSRIFVPNAAALWHWLEHNEKPILGIFTILLVIVTGVLAYFTGGLWNATAEIQRETRLTSRLELRAYVGFKEHVIRLIPNGMFQIQMLIENSGKTTARDVRLFMNYTVQDSGHAGPFPIEELRSPVPMAPNAQRSWRALIRRELPPNDVPRIAHDREIFVWGRIGYLDIYGERHHTDFRFNTRETITESGADAQGVIRTRIAGWALQPTEEGNDAS